MIIEMEPMNYSKKDFVPAGTVINMDTYSEPQAFNCPCKKGELANVNH